MNRTSTPSQPETMRMRVLTEGELADIIDSSETIDSGNVLSRLRDEPTIVQPQYGEFQMPEFVDSSGRINLDDISSWLLDEPATVQSQDVIFQMSPPQVPETSRMPFVLTEPGLVENSPASLQSQDNNFPSVPRVMTREEIHSFVDSSGRIDFDAIREWQRLERLRRAQPRDPIYPTPLREMTREEIYSFVDSSGMIDFDAIREFQGLEPVRAPPQIDPFFFTPLLEMTWEEILPFVNSSGAIDFDAIRVWQALEPVRAQTRDASSQMSPSETTRMSPTVLTEAGLADINDSSGWIDFYDISLRIEGEPASVQPLRALPRDPIYPTPLRVMTREEIHSFVDSSGSIDFDAIREWQGLEPIRAPPQYTVLSTPLREMTHEELHSFVNSSGAIDFDAIALFQRNNPDRFPPQDDILPPRQPETTSHEACQSRGLSEQTISKYLKTMSSDEISAQDIDGDQKICAVCLDDVCGQKDKVAILDECGHVFHYFCLKKWLHRKNTCPLCRRPAIFFLQDSYW